MPRTRLDGQNILISCRRNSIIAFSKGILPYLRCNIHVFRQLRLRNDVARPWSCGTKRYNNWVSTPEALVTVSFWFSRDFQKTCAGFFREASRGSRFCFSPWRVGRFVSRNSSWCAVRGGNGLQRSHAGSGWSPRESGNFGACVQQAVPTFKW